MTCDQAIELLPWLLNGTLGAEEREGVRQHLKTCERCRQALVETREAWQSFDQHLPSEALVALAWGERPTGLDPALAEAHLALCPQCAAELELARTSRRLEEDDRIAVFPGQAVRKQASRGYRGWRSAALAASLAGVVAAAGWFNSAQQLRLVAEQPPRAEEPAPAPEVSAAERKIAELEGQVQQMARQGQELQREAQKMREQIASSQSPPDLAPWLGTIISPAEDVIRGEDDGTAEVFRIPADATSVILPLTAPEGARGEQRIEIRNQRGTKIWEQRREPDEKNLYVIKLPSGLLTKGSYTIQVMGRPSATYKIRVE